MNKCLPIFFACLLAASTQVVANDLGVVGPLHGIQEKDLIDVITGRFKQMEKTGELAKKQEEYKNRVVNSLENPKPVPGISPTQTARVKYFDPSWTLDRDVRDQNGNLMFRRGTRVNPLDYQGYSGRMVFVDGSNQKHMQFALQQLKTVPNAKIVLVAGKPLDLMRRLQVRLYYDQTGTLSKRLGITHVPSVVSQESKRLRIDEIKID